MVSSFMKYNKKAANYFMPLFYYINNIISKIMNFNSSFCSLAKELNFNSANCFLFFGRLINC